MQAYKDDELVASYTGLLSQLGGKKKELEAAGTANRFITASLPEVGSEVEINGLKFYVFSRTDGGTVVLRLAKIK